MLSMYFKANVNFQEPITQSANVVHIHISIVALLHSVHYINDAGILQSS